MALNKHNFEPGQIFTAAQANAMEAAIIENETAIESKLNKYHGTANAGKVLVINSSGEAAPVDYAPIDVDDTLSINGAAADAKITGQEITSIKKSALYVDQKTPPSFVEVPTMEEFNELKNNMQEVSKEHLGTFVDKYMEDHTFNGMYMPDNIVLFEPATQEDEDAMTAETLLRGNLTLKADGSYLYLMFGEAVLGMVEMTGGGVAMVPCVSLVINQENMSLDIEDTTSHMLSATVQPFDTTDVIKWHSSDPLVVTIDSFGQLAIVGVGESTITCKCGNQTATITIRIIDKTITGWNCRRGYSLTAGNPGASWSTYGQSTRAYLYTQDVSTAIPVQAGQKIRFAWDNINEDYPAIERVCFRPIFFDSASKTIVKSLEWQGESTPLPIYEFTLDVPDGANMLSSNVLLRKVGGGDENFNVDNTAWLSAHLKIKDVSN